MADLAVMRRQLSMINSELMRLPVYTSGRPEDDKEAAKQAEKLDGIARRLGLILRDLNSSDQLARVQLENLRRVPRNQRWSAAQAIRQRSSNVAEVAAQAQQLADLVKDLLDRNGILPPVLQAKKLMDLIEDVEKHMHSHTEAGTHQPSPFPVYTAPGGGTIQVESLVPLVTLAYVLVRYWRDKQMPKE